MSSKNLPENWELTLYPKDQDITKDWYVEIKFQDPDTGEKFRKQKRDGMNYYKDLASRYEFAKTVMKALKNKILEGWNPFIKNKSSIYLALSDLSAMTFNEALEYGLKSKKPSLEPKSYTDIRGVKDFAKVAAVKCRLSYLPIGETRKKHIKILMDQIASDRQAVYDKAPKGKKYHGKKFTGNSYNKYRTFLQVIFAELEELEAIDFNPCDKLKNRPEIDTNLHRHATNQEMTLIKDHLIRNYPGLHIYLAFEYLTGIRPKELFGLQITDIDWFGQCFELQPTDGKSKTKKARRVPIPNALMPYLKKLNLERYQPNDFIFSDNFQPGPNRKHRDYVTKIWRNAVKIKLGVNVSLYSFKGRGGEDKRKAGIEAGSVSAQYGHSSMNMTKIYLKGEQDRINKEIIEKTPEF